LPDGRAVEVEGDRAALREPAAVVRELHPDLVLSGGDRGLAIDLELLETEQVVAVGRAAILRVDGPAAERSALRDHDAVGDRTLGAVTRRGGRVGSVLDLHVLFS